jgi:photosystem II stability/assembly factor-like uncharacterized protein
MNCVKTVAITMALLGCLIASVAPTASAQTGWAVGNSNGTNGTILYTSNGGTEWTSQTDNVPNVDFNSVAAIALKDSTLAWVVGKSSTKDGPGTILWNQGSGNNWIAQKNTEPGNLNGVFFADDGHGWAVGDKGRILFSNGTGKAGWGKQESNTEQDLYGVFSIKYVYRFKGGWKTKYYAWAVGNNGTILYYDGGWSSATGAPVGTKGTFRSVWGWDSDPQSKLAARKIVVYAVGDAGLGVWRYDSSKGGLRGEPPAWTKVSTDGGPVSNLKTVQVLSDQAVWMGQEGDNDVYGFNGKKWINKRDGDFGNVYGLSLTDVTHAWIVGNDDNDGKITGKIAYYNGKGSANGWSPTPQYREGPMLNSIVMTGTGGPGGLVQLEGASSPDSAGDSEGGGMNYVSLTGSGFPEGDITPANVVVNLATECHGSAAATSSAVSVVSASSDSNLISFLLPSGLAPGQYFVSVSDFEEGDASFESSNCSAINIVQ